MVTPVDVDISGFTIQIDKPYITGLYPSSARPGGSFTPFLSRFFEGGSQGDPAAENHGATALDAFDFGRGLSGQLTYEGVSPVPKTGNFCGKITTDPATNDWGGVCWKPDGPGSFVIGEGDELWCKSSVWIPSAFDWEATNPGFRKFQRISCVDSLSSNAGRLDFVIYADNKIELQFSEVRDFWTSGPNGNGTFKAIKSPVALPTDEWVDVEFYVFASSDAALGTIRLYINKVLQLEYNINVQSDSGTVTLGGPDYILKDFFPMGDFWNSTPSSVQSVYIDNIVLATNALPPTQTGSDGKLIVGTYPV
jgi:hypothetical protein